MQPIRHVMPQDGDVIWSNNIGSESYVSRPMFYQEPMSSWFYKILNTQSSLDDYNHKIRRQRFNNVELWLFWPTIQFKEN